MKIGMLMVSIILVLQLTDARADAGLSKLDTLYSSFYVFTKHQPPGLTDAEWGDAIKSDYRKNFDDYRSRGSEDELSASDIRNLFMASYLENFYVPSKEAAHDVMRYLVMLREKGSVKDVDYYRAHESFVRAREFTLALDLEKNHFVSGMEKLPDLKSSSVAIREPFAWRYAGTNNTLVGTGFPLHGTQVIAVGSPLCHFTTTAVDVMEKRKDVSNELPKIIWISPVGGTFNYDVYHSWNALHPSSGMSMVNSQGDWPMIESWATPTFYFLKDGKVTKTFSGWPPSGGEENFFKELHQWLGYQRRG